MRRSLALVLSLSLVVACSSKKRASDPPGTPPPPPVAANGTGVAANGDGEPAALTGDALREAALASAFVRRFENDHLRRHVLDDTISAEAFTAYLDRLDPGKLFLLAGDREALATHAKRIDDELHAGDLTLAHEAGARFTARVAVVEQMVAEILAGPIDHDDAEVVQLDDDKLAPAARP